MGQIIDFKKNSYPGKIIVFEGIDGSGKTTQSQMLYQYITDLDKPVVKIKWNSSDLVKKAIKKGKREHRLNPLTFSLIHATDFADNYTMIVEPALQDGKIVIADRWAYTGLARDEVRGLSEDEVREIYNFAPKPDFTFYMTTDIKKAMERKMRGPGLKWYEAGMDLHISPDIRESYMTFQGMLRDKYDEIAKRYDFIKIPEDLSIEKTFAKVKSYIDGKI